MNERWLKLVAHFHTKLGGLRRAIGRPAAREAEATKHGQRWIRGVALRREIVCIATEDRLAEATLRR